MIIGRECDFNVKHYTGEFNAYQRTYVILPHINLLFASIYISIQKAIETFKKRSCGAIIKFITIGDVASVPIIIHRDTTIFEMLNKILVKIESNERNTESVIMQRNELLPLLMNGQVSVNSDLADYSNIVRIGTKNFNYPNYFLKSDKFNI